tara:strand:+ start:131 stop:232 length:102 start_codon:yes stop_codon:yes gene_type:complete
MPKIEETESEQSDDIDSEFNSSSDGGALGNQSR